MPYSSAPGRIGLTDAEMVELHVALDGALDTDLRGEIDRIHRELARRLASGDPATKLPARDLQCIRRASYAIRERFEGLALRDIDLMIVMGIPADYSVDAS